jgi:pyruvate/2-oxoglutarate dehydrogenase complex dihydrolipoamide acyltransferase (E2) component
MRKSTIVLWLALAQVTGLSRGGPVEGITQPRTEVRVSSPVQEIVAEVMVEEGAVVKQGDTLARLVDDIEKAEFRRQEKVLEKRPISPPRKSPARKRNSRPAWKWKWPPSISISRDASWRRKPSARRSVASWFAATRNLVNPWTGSSRCLNW